MGYPQFGKVKDVVLPVPANEPLSLDEYKERYGIDLRDFIEYYPDGVCIRLKNVGGCAFYCSDLEDGIYDSASYALGHNGLYPCSAFSVYEYDYGKSHATLKMGTYLINDATLVGIEFIINQNVENPTTEDIKVSVAI